MKWLHNKSNDLDFQAHWPLVVPNGFDILYSLPPGKVVGWNLDELESGEGVIIKVC